jgi:ABC-type multidrug transport system fused ATPase/permease subunit
MKNIFYSLNNFLTIFAKKKKKIYYYFIFSNLIVALLEMLSLAVLFPLMSLIVDSSFVIEIKKYNISFVDNLTLDQILISLLFLMMMLFLIKNFLIGWLSWLQIKYSLYLQNEVATTLLKKYIYSSYLFFKSNDSSKFIRILNNDSFVVITGFIIPSFFFFTEIFIFLGIIILLSYYEIKGLIIVLFFFGISFFIYKKFSKKLKENGILSQNNQTLKIKFATNIFEGIKEILFYKKQSFFFRLYRDVNLRVNSSQAFLEGVKILPRLLLEVIGIFVFCFVMVSLILAGKDLAKLVPLLAVYIVAGFKILPSLNRIISAAQQMRFNKIYLDSAIFEYSLETGNKIILKNKIIKYKTINFNNKIELKNICFDYKTKNREKSVLKNLNLSFEKNSITAIVGRSGSGKSTIVDILLGLIKQDSGQILVDGKIIDKDILKLKVGYVPQSLFLLNDTIKKNIALGIRDEEIDLAKVNKAIRLSSLVYDLKHSKLNLDSIVGQKGLQISGGQAQRIAIARSLYDDPEIIIFDEATSSLDKSTEKEICENLFILKKTKTILLVTHNDRILKYCDKVISLD